MKTKYTYLKVIQQYYGQGWEDNSEYITNSQGTVKDNILFKSDLKEYKFTGYPTRVIQRKVLN
jgi:hypothetical protein